MTSPITPRNPPQNAPDPTEDQIHNHTHYHPDHTYLQSPEAAGARVRELTRKG